LWQRMRVTPTLNLAAVDRAEGGATMIALVANKVLTQTPTAKSPHASSPTQ
jgi:hypothetical protein